LAPRIVLEVTERGVPDHVAVRSLVQNWSGVQVALDDVTLLGGANLAILARCAFDVVKLDRSLIAELDGAGPAPEWLTGLTALVRVSSLRIVAEGVETDEQRVALREAGVQGAQGFYFSRPLGAAAFMAYYDQR
jgi:EAL domain-containing protein (putative c-di-GMP-specific phosphodiesterase class I)